MTKKEEHPVLEPDLLTKQVGMVRRIITLEEQRDLVESVLNFKEANMNSSQDFEGFVGLHIPPDNL